LSLNSYGSSRYLMCGYRHRRHRAWYIIRYFVIFSIISALLKVVKASVIVARNSMLGKTYSHVSFIISYRTSLGVVRSGLREDHASGDGNVAEPQRIQRLENVTLRNSRTGRVKSERHLAETTCFSWSPIWSALVSEIPSTFPDIKHSWRLYKRYTGPSYGRQLHLPESSRFVGSPPTTSRNEDSLW
jgi:hypothetical protein